MDQALVWQWCKNPKRTYQQWVQRKTEFLWLFYWRLMINFWSELLFSLQFLKSNAYNNKASRIWFHRLPRQFLPRDHGGFGHKN